ncbi:MAG: peptidyl-prolyl cis-trans isomerase [Solirubrobacteraceae bacterium]
MTRSARIAPALGAFFVLALALSACGSGVPGNAVVRVDDVVIKDATFDHWMRIAALSSQQPGQPAATVPDAPDFKKCIAAKLKAPAPPGQPKASAARAKSTCKQEYEGLRDQVLQFLIQAEWLEGEASDQDVKLSNKEIKASFLKQKKESFPTPKEYADFLKTSGFTEDDVLLRVKLDLLSEKIQKKVVKEGSKVSEKDVQAYYNRNKQRFAQPEQRNLAVVLTKTLPQARAARAAIARNPASFAAVARRSSIDQGSKAQGGKLLNVTPGQQEKAFDDAIFRAPLNQLVGPVKTQFGFYVFKVTKATPAKQQTLAQATKSIRQLVKTEKEQKALDAFVKKFQKKWTERTNCRKGFVTEMCKNAPKAKRGQPAPPGAVPQQGGGQQVPPQGGQQVPPQGGQQVPPQGGQQVPPQGGQQVPQQVPPQGGQQVPPQQVPVQP